MQSSIHRWWRVVFFGLSTLLLFSACTPPTAEEAKKIAAVTEAINAPEATEISKLLDTLGQDLSAELNAAGYGSMSADVVDQAKLLAATKTTVDDAAAEFMRAAIAIIAIFDGVGFRLSEDDPTAKEDVLGMITKVVFAGMGKGYTATKSEAEMLGLVERLIGVTIGALKEAGISGDNVANAIQISVKNAVANLDELGFTASRGFAPSDLSQALASISNTIIANASSLDVESKNLASVFGALAEGAVAALADIGVSAKDISTMAVDFAKDAIKQIEKTSDGKTYFTEMASLVTRGAIASLAIAGVGDDKIVDTLDSMMKGVSEILTGFSSIDDLSAVLTAMSQEAIKGLDDAGLDNAEISSAASVINKAMVSGLEAGGMDSNEIEALNDDLQKGLEDGLSDLDFDISSITTILAQVVKDIGDLLDSLFDSDSDLPIVNNNNNDDDDDDDDDDDEPNSDLPIIFEPQLSLSLVSSTPKTTPTIMVLGADNLSTIAIFSDAACTNKLGEAPATSHTVLITTSILATGRHTIYANQTDAAGNVSACSTASLRYEVTLPNSWTLMSGRGAVQDSSNRPPWEEIEGSGIKTVHDATGNIWQYGGNYKGSRSDLWKFDKDSMSWTHLSGNSLPNQAVNYATPTPGGRRDHAITVDTDGNFWLFGGYDSGYNFMNDLWKFSVNQDGEGTWTCVFNCDRNHLTGVYSGVSVYPGARLNAALAADHNGNLWLFGGPRYDLGNNSGNDLWKFDIANSTWTFVSGSEGYALEPVYTGGDLNPGGRYNVEIAIDSANNLWLFGGEYSYRNDLWKFDGSAWSFIRGSQAQSFEPSISAGIGVSDAENTPSARDARAQFLIDSADQLWLFGGLEYGSWKKVDDLWKFDGTNWVLMSGGGEDQSEIRGVQGEAAASNQPGRRIRTGASFVDGKLTLVDAEIWTFDPTNSQWTWVSGEALYGGRYGIKGVASADNFPGERYDHTSVMDAANNLWVFGGWGFDSSGIEGYLNDLWKFDGTNWTWVSGNSDSDNTGEYGTIGTPGGFPGARYEHSSSIDAAGQIYIFGGYGYADEDSGYLNDLWRFDPRDSTWTYLSGDSSVDTYGPNSPGARYYHKSVVDLDGNFWVFGGSGYTTTGDNGDLNDLWKFDPLFNEWSLESGSDATYQNGVYEGLASELVPGARYAPSFEISPSGEFYLFGGFGYDSAGDGDYLGDLWKYSPSTNLWTFLAGSDVIVYTDTGLNPSSRYDAASAVDKDGNFWVFSGYGYYGPDEYEDYLNDLWKFDGEEWTRIGDSSEPTAGVYGATGTSSTTFKPASRYGGSMSADEFGNLWLFGGWGYIDDALKEQSRNDFMRYVP